MRKNKLAKLLLAIGIGSVTALSGVAIAGCAGKCNAGDDQEKEDLRSQFTVKFDVNGGTGTYANATVYDGDKVDEPSVPPTHSDTNKVFDGWWTTKDNTGKKWNFVEDPVTGSMTLYAHWKDNGTTPPATDPTSITADKTTKTYTLSGGSATIVVTDVTVTPNQGTLDGWTTTYSLKKGETAIDGNGPWTVTSAGTYTLTVTVTKNGTSTALTDTITITVNEEGTTPPVEEVTSISATKTTAEYTLSGGKATITVDDITVVDNNEKALSAEWTITYSLKKGETAIDGNGPWEVQEAGAYTITVTAAKGTSASLTATIPVTVNPESTTPPTDEAPKVTIVDTLVDYAESYTDQGSEVTAVKSGEKYQINEPTAPTNPAGTNYKFDGYYEDEELTRKITFPMDVEDDTTIYMGWWETVKDTSLNSVITSMQPSYGSSSAKFTGKSGRFGFTGGVYFEVNNSNIPDSHKDVNLQKNSLVITFTGNDNSLELDVYQPNAFQVQKVTVGDDGYTVSNYGETLLEAALTDSTKTIHHVKLEHLEAGSYAIGGNSQSGSCRIGNLVLSEDFRPANATGIEIDYAGARTLFFKGETFSSEGLVVNRTYGNGSKRQIFEEYTVSTPTMTTVGKQTVTVTSTENDAWETKTYEIEVVEVTGIQLVSSKLNDFAPTVYYVNDKFDSSLFSVNFTGTDSNDKPVTFYGVSNSFYNITYPTTLTETGVKTLEVTKKDNEGIKDTFTYYVIPTLPETTQTVEVMVNPEGEIGELTTKTIQQAIDYLKAMNLGEAVIKQVKLTTGKEYKEKVIIDVPNLVLYADDAKSAKDSENGTYQLTTKIWFDAINTALDPSGNAWANDKNENTNAVVVVTAPNVTIKNIVIENYWNTYERANAHDGNDQALALFVNADKFTLINSALSSFQDTLKLYSGRSLVLDSYIEGCTDFIYGETNTTYFYNSKIYSKQRDSEKVGGYITAFKGGSGDTNYVEYGAIFDHCEFVADAAEITKQGTSIARPWAAYSAVAIINSTLGGHISKKGYTDTPAEGEKNTEGLRYVTGLSSAKPTDNDIKFYEYNNTGDGAIEEAVSGMKFLDATSVKAYELFSSYTNATTYTINPEAKIFLAASNEHLSPRYTDDWKGESVENVLVTVVKKGAEVAQDKDLAKTVIYKNTGITVAELTGLVPISELTDGQTIDKFYTDRDCTAEYTGGALTENTKLYYTEKTKPAVQTETHTLQIPSSGEWSSNTVIGSDNFFMVIADNNAKVTKIETSKNSNTGYSKNGKNLTFTHQFSLTSGGMKSATTGHGIGFTIPEGKTAKVTLYAAAKSDKAACALKVYNGSSEQKLTDLQIDGQAASALGYLSNAANDVKEYTFTIETPGTIGIGGDSGGAYIYGLIVEITG